MLASSSAKGGFDMDQYFSINREIFILVIISFPKKDNIVKVLGLVFTVI